MQHNDYVDLLPLKEGYTTVIGYTIDVERCCVDNINKLQILVVYTTLPSIFQAFDQVPPTVYILHYQVFQNDLNG